MSKPKKTPAEKFWGKVRKHMPRAFRDDEAFALQRVDDDTAEEPGWFVDYDGKHRYRIGRPGEIFDKARGRWHTFNGPREAALWVVDDMLKRLLEPFVEAGAIKQVWGNTILRYGATLLWMGDLNYTGRAPVLIDLSRFGRLEEVARDMARWIRRELIDTAARRLSAPMRYKQSMAPDKFKFQTIEDRTGAWLGVYSRDLNWEDVALPIVKAQILPLDLGQVIVLLYKGKEEILPRVVVQVGDDESGLTDDALKGITRMRKAIMDILNESEAGQ